MNTKIATFGLSLSLMAGISFSGVLNFNASAQLGRAQRPDSPRVEQVERLQPVPLKPLEKTDPKAQLAPEWLNVTEEVPPMQKGVYSVKTDGTKDRYIVGGSGSNDAQFSATYDYLVVTHSGLPGGRVRT